ncbi:hypothetical protein [uncultured Cohaesibacter sp.]|uniref:hypothetical protein n=1 Tax=uncultured Cohaesibacter sp. TaxID=1002546 RepID=UPI002AA7B7A1|nr:hypothetical protein [uncultured Cohaesibacter sp.]
MKSRLVPRGLLLISLMILPLMSCASQMASGESEHFNENYAAMPKNESGKMTACLLFDTITWSSKDTDQTITEVKRHNQKIVTYCAK